MRPRAGRATRPATGRQPPPLSGASRRVAALQRERARAARRAQARAHAHEARSAMSPQHVPPDLRASARRQSRAAVRAAIRFAVRAAGRGHAVGTGDRQERQSCHAQAVRRARTRPQAMLRLGLAGLKRHIRTIGLYNTKARNILATCRHAVEQLRRAGAARSRGARGRCPAWAARPPTSCSTSPLARPTHRRRHACVSGRQPHRPGTRRQSARGRRSTAAGDSAQNSCSDAHHWLMLHGRYVCKARRPECPRCPIARWCEYQDKTPP